MSKYYAEFQYFPKPKLDRLINRAAVKSKCSIIQKLEKDENVIVSPDLMSLGKFLKDLASLQVGIKKLKVNGGYQP